MWLQTVGFRTVGKASRAKRDRRAKQMTAVRAAVIELPAVPFDRFGRPLPDVVEARRRWINAERELVRAIERERLQGRTWDEIGTSMKRDRVATMRWYQRRTRQLEDPAA